MRQLHVDLIMDRCRVVMEQKMTYHYAVDVALPNTEINPKTVSVAQPQSRWQTNFSERTPYLLLVMHTPSRTTHYCNLS